MDGPAAPGGTGRDALRSGAGWTRAAHAVQAAAGLVGAAGVALAAAAAHKGGGDLTAVAATFAILHAGAMVALTGSALAGSGAVLVVAAGLMGIGTALFSGDLALVGLFGSRPWPQAAPLGGVLLILAWVGVATSAALRAVRC